LAAPAYHGFAPGIQATFSACTAGAWGVWYVRAVRVVVCDVGLGNLRSVERALREAGRGARVDVEITSDPARVRQADVLVMPGQGGFADCARALAGDLGTAVREHLAAERPYLGICLGLQVLFESSEEAPGAAGLGLRGGSVVRLPRGDDAMTGTLKIPHVGWNTVEPVAGVRSILPAEPTHFYFVHSYAASPSDTGDVCGWTEYGVRFPSAIARGNVFACQFHPEKSQRAGLALLARFLAS
jgi:glutamine amidotransferase